MTVSQERMVVVLEARLDKLEKGFQKAKATSAAVMGGIVTDANKMEAAISRVGAGGFDRAAKGARNLKGQTGNLAAQFNDIGVQLAGGQSPFLIALQQGTQITQALGPMGARGAVAALGGAFMSLLNPLSLVTIGVIGLGGYAVQKLTEWYSAGEITEKQLKEQADLIRQVAARWGETVPAIQAYVEQQDKAIENEKLLAAAGDLASKEFDPLRDTLKDIGVAAGEARMDMQDLGASSQDISAVSSAFDELRKAVDENSDTTDEYKALQDAVSAVLKGSTSPAIEELSNLLAANASAFAAASAEAGKYREEAALATMQQLGPLGSLSPLESGGGKFLNPAEAQNFRASNTKSQFQIESEKASKRGGSGSRSSSISEAQREAEAVGKLIEQLEFERSLIGMTDVEREKANALRRAGSAATDEQRAKIEGLIEASYREEQAHEAAEDAIRRQKEAMEELGQIGMDAINGIVGALEDGKVTGEEMIQIVGRLIQQLLSMPSGGGGGLLSSLFGGLFGGGGSDPWAGLRIPKFASGTNNFGGGLARINERGGEIVNLPSGTQIIPHDVSVKAMKGATGGGVSVNFAPVYNVQGSGPEIAQLRQQMARDKAELPGRVVQAVQGARKRNVRI